MSFEDLKEKGRKAQYVKLGLALAQICTDIGPECLIFNEGFGLQCPRTKFHIR